MRWGRAGQALTAVHDATTTYARPKFVTNSHCEIRKGIGELTAEGDVSWSLERDPEALAADVEPRLRDAGLPFLDGLSSRAEILQAWNREGESLGFPPLQPTT